MKIYGNKVTEAQDVRKAEKTGRNEPAGEKVPAEKTESADKVELSSAARKIDELKAVIGGLPEIRSDKVQEIGKAISDGTYKVDPQKIAGRMIDELA